MSEKKYYLIAFPDVERIVWESIVQYKDYKNVDSTWLRNLFLSKTKDYCVPVEEHEKECVGFGHWLVNSPAKPNEFKKSWIEEKFEQYKKELGLSSKQNDKEVKGK